MMILSERLKVRFFLFPIFSQFVELRARAFYGVCILYNQVGLYSSPCSSRFSMETLKFAFVSFKNHIYNPFSQTGNKGRVSVIAYSHYFVLDVIQKVSGQLHPRVSLKQVPLSKVIII